MKKILFAIALLSSLHGMSQAVSVSSSSHTPAQLVQNVLVQNSCLVQISNISVRTGSNVGTVNGIGYYQNTNSSFPVGANGVILSTGKAEDAPGPNNSFLGATSAAWAGDPALEAALAASGINIATKNATVLEFDFVPNSTTFSFDFLFASEEYGNYQCAKNDAFAVFLTQGSTTQNVAVIPSTTLPITVGNIRNNLYNSTCASANPAYFGQFNGGANAASSPTNFNGQTVLMHAGATVIPNVSYHIKFVIADDGGTLGTDGDYDSAVFLPAGSLNLGQKLFGTDLTIANGNPLCFGDSYVLETNLDDDIYDFTWTRNNNPIGATGPSIVVTQPGDYAVTLSRPDISCNTTQSIKIEYAPQIMAGQPNHLYKCDNGSGSYAYNLSLNTPVVKQGLDPNTVVTYHASPADADTGANALPLTYNSPGGVTIYVRVKNPGNSCYTTKTFQLLTSPAPAITQPQDLALCESSQGSNTAIFDLTQQNPTILGMLPPNENNVTYYTSLAAATSGTSPIAAPTGYNGTTQTIYARVEKSFDSSCYSVTQFNLTVHPLPVLPDVAQVDACNNYTLPALTVGNYYTGNGGTGTQLPAGTVITTSQNIYIYAQSGGNPNCSNQKVFYVNIITAATAPEDVTACQSYTLPTLSIGEYHDQPAGGGNILAPGTVITSTQTIYYFIPSAASCTQNNSFTVTITSTPVVTDPADVNSCGPYTLPTLPNGEFYYTQANAGGTQLPDGYVVTASRTIYIHTSNPANPACTAQSDFNVTINNVDVQDVDDVDACGSYTLPPLAVGKYYTGPGGTGTQLAFNSSVNTSQTIYVYAAAPGLAGCFDEDSFVVTIHPLPILDPIANVSACGSYTLPALPANAQYYTGPNGTGSIIPAGTVITTNQTIYALAFSGGTPNCRRQRQFTVTIINVTASNPGDVTACGAYTLPPLASGHYFTGPNGTGTQLAANSAVTVTKTIYIYAVSNTTPQCTDQASFVVTIKDRPILDPIPNVVACTSYTLPALPNGNYYNSLGGSGTMIPAGTVITSSQTIYAYAETGGTPNCTRQRSFTVTIINGSIAPSNITACGHYQLPPLSQGAYYTGPNGTGTNLPVGYDVTSTQTIYVRAAVTDGTNCTDTNSFVVNIQPALTADNPGNQFACTSYTLPPVTNGNYYTGPGGSGTMLHAGDAITSTQTIYVFNYIPGQSNCNAENSFVVTIANVTADTLPNQVVCNGYQLPALLSGNYFTQSGGNGTMLHAGDMITTDQTIYIYATSGTTPNCISETSFTVTIKPVPVIDNPGTVVSCGNYVLPALTGGSYWTNSGGTGLQLFPGQLITTSQTLYIFAQTGGTPNCSVENEFIIVINPEPPTDVTVCDSYVLPALAVGEYHTAPAGGGATLPAGQLINSTQDVYVYIPMTMTPNCTDNNKFRVTVNHTPVLAPQSNVAQCDSYTLPPLAVGNYYTGPNGTGTLLPANTVLTTSQTIYVYAQTSTTPNCSAQTQFNVTINRTPVLDARSDVEVCFSYQLEPLLVGNYYTGPNGTGTMLPAGFLITSTQTIYIYAQSGTTPNCAAENSFIVTVYSITADNPADVFECDSYTLPALSPLNKYYTFAGGPDEANPAANPEIPAGTAITSTQTIHVFAATGGRVNCTDENSFTVNIFHTPAIDHSQGDFAQCTPYTLPPLTVGNYYTGPGGTGTQLSAGFVVTTPTTIYIYGENPQRPQCNDQHSYIADVRIVQVDNPGDKFSCGPYTLPALTSGNYYTGPNGTGTMLNAGQVINTTTQLYIYAQNVGPTLTCRDQRLILVTIVTAPTAFPVTPRVTCGVDDLGHGIFDLTSAITQAIGGQANTSASVHETLADAQFGQNAIANPAAYANVNAYNQTVYIRVYHSIATECYNVSTVQLTVNPRPVAVEPQPYELCDDNTDGIATFDLTTRNAEVLGTMNPANFTVTYHTQASFAEAGTPVIPNPAAYSSPTNTIYVRVTNNVTGCYDVVALDLVVNALPTANNPTPYTQCDINNPGDEREVFDLNSKRDEITGGAFGVNLDFFHSYADAQAGINAIPNPESYTNGATVETLFVRVSNDATGCFRIVLLDVRVEPLPIVNVPVPLDDVTVCDMDGNGYGVFNLQALIPGLVNNGANLSVQFFETIENAENNVDPIGNPAAYSNVIPDLQTIYVRVENTVTGCVNWGFPIDLHVNRSPQVPALQDLEFCDDTDTNNQNYQMVVDLTVQTTVIEAAIGTGNTIHYFTSEIAANNGAPRIVNPAAFLASNAPAGTPQTIWVRVEDANGCYGVESFDVIINRPLAINTPAMFAQCNEALPNDGLTEFDLTTRDNEILGPAGIGAGFTVQYYELDPRTNATATPIADPAHFTNVTNAQTLFVVVTSPEGCKSYTTLTIKVLPLPTPRMNPDALELCDDTGNVGEETFDLTLAAQQIRNNDSFAQLSYYTSQADAELGVNAIATPTAWTSVSATIYVRVEAGDSNPQNPRCAVIVPLQIIVNPLPVVGDGTQIRPYAICEPATDGFATFLLNSRMSDILMTQNPADYNVKFYKNDPVTNQPGTVTLPNQYVNQIMGHEVIWVRVQNLTTDCVTFMPWDLYVELEAVANAAGNLATCDDDGTNDGLHLFDLTTQNTTILGPLQPEGIGQYMVEYYETDPQTDPTATPIANPAAWTNTTPDAQTIYVRVYNDGTISKCSDYTAFNVEVNRLPEPVLAPGTICVEYGTNTVIRTYTLDPQIPGGDVANGYLYTWYKDGVALNDPVADPSSNTATYEVTQAGNYTVSVVSPAGCTSDPIAAVTVSQSGPAVAVGVGYEVSNAFSADQTITITVAGYGVYEYRLDYGPWQTSNIFTDVPRGSHTVYVRDVSTDDPCDDAGMILELEDISIIDYPKFFTPNADGHNDTWNITGLGGQLDAKIYIFDRYGKLLKQISSSNESQGWDGTYNGAPLIADDYWFTVTYREMVNGVEVTKEFKSHFSLKR